MKQIVRQEKEHLEFEMRIPDFLKDRLGNEELEQFLDHYDHCRECREELAVRYLIEEGLARLETGKPFIFRRSWAAMWRPKRGTLQGGCSLSG